jgi:glycosyltransferase involved in cell wall biosynthesis
MEFYSPSNANTKQLTTSRKRPKGRLHKDSAIFEKRFVYLGFVNEQKGIDHLLEAADILGDEYTLHIYGPLKDSKYNNIDSKFYKGVLHQSEVLATLSKYDVLLLPTYYEGEGYPGAIIEAYSIGLPVIATSWKAIPEIVRDGKTGILIEPRSTEALVDAMKMITKANYTNFSSNAFKYFSDTFDEEIVLEKVRQDLKEL